MKGEQTLYNNLVPSSLADLEGGTKSQRNTYLDQRSDAMACRYYYHANLCRLRYDDCLYELSCEFFLEPETIVGYLKKRHGLLNSLVNKSATPKQLRRKYPYFEWSIRTTVIQTKSTVKTSPAGSFTLF